MNNVECIDINDNKSVVLTLFGDRCCLCIDKNPFIIDVTVDINDIHWYIKILDFIVTKNKFNFVQKLDSSKNYLRIKYSNIDLYIEKSFIYPITYNYKLDIFNQNKIHFEITSDITKFFRLS